MTGSEVTILDGPTSADGYDWYQVETDDGTGWVAQEGAAGGSGRGLAGIRERAASLGGSSRSGPTTGGEFEVQVRFPS